MRGGIVLGSQSKRRGGEGEKEGNMGLGAPWEREAQKEDLEAGVSGAARPSPLGTPAHGHHR